MFRLSTFASLTLAAIMTATMTGCGEQTEAFIHVDNGSKATMVVHVDGQELGPVAAGQVKKFKIDLGQRKFKVTVAGRSIYERTHTLSYGDRPYRRPVYILNPDHSHRYCQVKVLYGDNSLTDATADLLVSSIAWAANQGHEEISEEERQRNIDHDRLNSAYQKLLGHGFAYDYEPFIEVDSHCQILQPVPNVMYTSQYNSSTSMTTIMRVSPEIHNFLRAAKLKTRFTEQDVREMAEMQFELQDIVPTRQ